MINSTWSNEYKSPNWQRKKNSILQRDNYTCCACGETQHQLTVHHLYYEKRGHVWDIDDDGLVTVCNSCHEKIHELNKLSGIIAFKVIRGDINLAQLHLRDTERRIISKTRYYYDDDYYYGYIKPIPR